MVENVQGKKCEKEHTGDQNWQKLDVRIRLVFLMLMTATVDWEDCPEELGSDGLTGLLGLDSSLG